MASKNFLLGGSAGATQLREKTENIIYNSEFNFKLIKIEKIIPNTLNKDFKQVDIDVLSRSIEDIGLQHNLVVLKQDDGNYRIISGERRYRAICLLLKRDPEHPLSNGIPCKVLSNIDEVEEEIRLLRSNTDTRELSPNERRKAILRLIDLYKIKKDKGEIKSTYAALAEDLQMSVRQIQKYVATGNLIPALEELLDKGIIALNDAEKFSILDEEGQLMIAELLKRQGSVSKEELDEIKRLKEEKELLKKELSSKIENLVKEKEQLKTQIYEQQKRAEEMSRMMEIPDVDIEKIVMEKARAEEMVEKLTRQKEQLHEKYETLKEELKKPVEIDFKRLEEIKATVKVEAALSRIEDEFAILKSKSKVFFYEKDLFSKYKILCDRFLSLIENIKVEENREMEI